MRALLLIAIAAISLRVTAGGPSIIVHSVQPDTVCQLSAVIVSIEMTDTFPPGPFEVQISDSAGHFSPGTLIGHYNLSYGALSAWLLVYLPLLPPGSCYQILVGHDLPGTFTYTTSDCFSIKACANTITTLLPAVASSYDTACSLSAIDVEFYSTGVYLGGNDYIAQLSDEHGNFRVYDTVISGTDTALVPRDVFQVIGELINHKTTYDPSTFTMPGLIPGNIPQVPAGCNYFIRVVSNRPEAVGSVTGPFCIRHCDITTNNMSDLHLCIGETTGYDTTLSFDIHTWDSSAIYFFGNQFSVQLLDRQYLYVLNTGTLGSTFSSSSSITLSVPGRDSLTALGIQPGEYYMRIIADSSSHPWNISGSLIRLTIGAPDDNAPALVPDKYIYCTTEIASITIVPFNYGSQYEWYNSIFFPQGFAVYRNSTLNFNFVGASPGSYDFRTREVSFGCRGPISNVTSLLLTDSPSITLTAPDTVYAGDTVMFSATFFPNTYYSWSFSAGTIIDTSNNTVTVRFDTAGRETADIFIINNCGTASDSIAVVVLPDTSITTHTFSGTIRETLLLVYPNPAGGYLFLSLPDASSEAHITDIYGRKLKEVKLANQRIDVTAFPSGIYFLQIYSKGKIYCQQFVKK